MMYYTGIDIGSTAPKVAVLDSEKMVANFVIPTGWNSKDKSPFPHSTVGQSIPRRRESI